MDSKVEVRPRKELAQILLVVTSYGLEYSLNRDVRVNRISLGIAARYCLVGCHNILPAVA